MPDPDALRADLLTGLRFALIGLAGTGVHVAMVILAVEVMEMDARLANILAFLTAFPLSYAGHYHFSFRSRHDHASTLARFGIIAILSFLAGQSVMHLAILYGYSYGAGLAGVVLTVPLASFLLNKFVVFQRRAKCPA